MKYQSIDGKIFEGDDYFQIAEALWKSKFMPENTLIEWMAGSAKRAKMWNGSAISTASADEHIKDLIRYGFLKEV